MDRFDEMRTGEKGEETPRSDENSESFPMMIETPLKKKPAFFNEIDLTHFTVKLIGQAIAGKGGNLKCSLGKDGKRSLTFAICHGPEDACFIPFGLEMTPQGDLPHFLGGPENKKKIESLNMGMHVSSEVKDFIKRIDEQFLKQAQENCKTWFPGKNIDEAQLRMRFKSPLIDDKPDVEPLLRMTVPLSTSLDLSALLTSFCLIRPADQQCPEGSLERGSGWGWAEKRVTEQNKWAGCKIMPVLDIGSAWISGQNFGYRVRLQEAVIILQSPAGRVDMYGDDDALCKMFKISKRQKTCS